MVNPTVTTTPSQTFSFITSVQMYSQNDRLMEQYSDVGRMATKIFKKRTNIQCTDPNCAFCLEGETDNCIACTQPGEFPLISADTNVQFSKGTCHT
jgi:hypothetical protein